MPKPSALRLGSDAGGEVAAWAELDSRRIGGEVGLHSMPFPVQPEYRYELRARVKRIAGDGVYKIAVEWQNAGHEHLGYANSWNGLLVGRDWEPHTARVTVPAKAAYARILIGVAGANAFCVSGLDLVALAKDESPACVVAASPASRPIIDSRVQERASDALPPPQSPEVKVQLGAYYFPVMLDWDRAGWGVRKVDYFKPLLGYYDETLPVVADWHIRWAIEHGITWFAFDWYYNQGMLYLNDAMEKGFLRSRFADRMKFCLDWCNEGHCNQFKPLDFSQKSLDDMTRLLCERYFSRSNYLRVDGRPVVLIHQPNRIVNAHGNWDGCRKALDGMRGVARSFGHPGVYFVAVQNNPWLLDYAKGGFDCATSYAYGFCDVSWGKDRSLPYEELIPRHADAFANAKRLTAEQHIGYIPTAWVGWDDAGRSREHAVRTRGNTPEAFERMVEMLPRYADPKLNLALVEAWNEWGEGGAVEPGIQYGFGYLDAIRRAIVPEGGEHVDFVPTGGELAQMQTNLRYEQVHDGYLRRYARELKLERGLDLAFDTPRGLWLLPVNQVADVRIENGTEKGVSTGNDPQLAGPPFMNLEAGAVRAVRIVMSVTAGRQCVLFWTKEEDADFVREHSISFPLIADGEMHEYTLNLSGVPGWIGIIRQFRFDVTDAPADWAIDRFRTD